MRNNLVRFIHFSDLHIGVENYGPVNPESGFSFRLEDFLGVFDELVDFALGNDVELVLFCGDAYKGREPSPTHQREFAKRVARLAHNGVKVFLLAGNHDIPNARNYASAIEIFQTLSTPNVIIADRPEIYRIKTKEAVLQVAALPWLKRSGLLSREEYKGVTFEEMNRALEETLANSLITHIEKLDRGLPSLLAAHVTVSTAKLGSERSMMVGQDPVLLLSNLMNPAFDYVALGHIHKAQVLCQKPPVVYPGSLERVDFSEEADDKGFFVVDMDPRGSPGERVIEYRFHKVKARPFVTIDVEIPEGEDNPTAFALKSISQKDLSQAVVRVNIKVPASIEGLIRETEVRRAILERGAFFVACVAKEIQTRSQRSARLGDLPAEKLTPIETLKLYLELKKVPHERIPLILEYGRKLVSGSLAQRE
ncbi:MAG: exonuclease SbcCD subunit D [Chloroflexi bacterium]|nr:exonuclease SbcCD subunit D [Chloroflexota bacterium]